MCLLKKRPSRHFRMKFHSHFSKLGLVGTGVVVLALLGTGATPALARKKTFNTLQIWPGQRVLVVLPLNVNPDFLSPDAASGGGTTSAATTAPAAPTTPSDATATDPTATMDGAAPSGSDELRTALVPVISNQLSSALQNTGKFSLVRPYKFDPILRRGLLEQSISDEDLNGFVLTPSLASAQAVLSKITLDQPSMVAQVTMENLRVGGTAQNPTVQVRMHGDLYQAGLPQPFRSITVTSKPYGGRTPEDRLRGAAGEAFNDIAAAFVEPPAEFQLPLPVGPPSSKTGNNNGMGGTSGSSTTTGGTGGGAMSVPLVPVAPGSATITAPNPLSPTLNGPVAPTLPPATPPLGLNVPTPSN